MAPSLPQNNTVLEFIHLATYVASIAGVLGSTTYSPQDKVVFEAVCWRQEHLSP